MSQTQKSSAQNLLLILLLIASFVIGISSDIVTWANLHRFSLFFLSIFIEAVPFLLLGSIVSGLIEAFVTPEHILRFAPKNKVLQPLFGLVAGFVFPVCECGVVPVARRLMKKGLSPSTAVTFLLAAPVMNPITLLSTYTAFGFGTVLAARYAVTAVVAVTAGILLSRGSEQVVEKAEKPYSHQTPFFGRLADALAHATDDFFNMGQYFILGCLLASLSQMFVSTQWFSALASHPFASVGVMQLLAYVMSICSTVDAFVALGYASTFTTGSIIAFLTFGPMVDIKSTMMYAGAFGRRAVVALIVLPLLMTFLAGVLLNFLLAA